MKHLLDTNVLTRSADPGHAMYAAAKGAVQALLLAGHGRLPALYHNHSRVAE
jgi:hypothetical protein